MTDLNVKIYFEDEHIIVCEKPSGVIPDGDGSPSRPTMPFLLNSRPDADPQRGAICVHRLDKETSGLMVFAKGADAAAELSAQIRDSRLEKEYIAVIEGAPAEKNGAFEDMLFYDRSKNKSYVIKGSKNTRKGVKRAYLEYTLLESDGKTSIEKVKLFTGRTHQIRVQFASRGMPLVADRRYGAKPSEQKHFYLHASSLSFFHPKTNQKLSFSSTPDFYNK